MGIFQLYIYRSIKGSRRGSFWKGVATSRGEVTLYKWFLGNQHYLFFFLIQPEKNALRYVCWMLENMNQTIGWLVSTFIAGHMDLAWFVLMLIILSSTKCNRTNMLNLGGVICGSPTLMMVGSCLELACNLSSWLYPPMIVQELSKLGVFLGVSQNIFDYLSNTDVFY